MDVSATGLLRSKKPPYLWEVCILRTWDTWTGDALLLDERLAVTRLPAPKPEPSTGRKTGKPLQLDALLPQQVGQTKELWVRVGDEHRHLMRLLILRVPEEVAKLRRADLEADAKRRGQPVRERAWKLADWTILLTDVPANPPSLAGSSCLISRERWQMEMLYKLWKQYGRIDEWRTTNSWRVLCELYAKLIGLLLQHWLIILFAWHDEQRSLVKLAQVVRDTASSLLEALAGGRSLLSALQAIQRRMGSGCQMNKRKKHPNAAQLLQRGSTNWALSP